MHINSQNHSFPPSGAPEFPKVAKREKDSPEYEPDVHYTRVRGTDGDDLIEITQKPNDVMSFVVTVNGKSRCIPRNYDNNFWVDGRKGNDTILFQGDMICLNNVIVQGGEGNDVIKGPRAEHAALRGGPGDDVLIAHSFGDSLEGGSGNDTLIGGQGNDFLAGGEGNDMLVGGPGDDTLYGGEEKDTICGGTGENNIWGLEKNDVVITQPDDDDDSSKNYIIAKQ
jgi:Ca2+-binding RTX toxin-like protein